MDPAERVGILGLGGIGMAITRRLVAAGLAPCGFRRSDASSFAQAGGIVCLSVPQLVEQSDVVINTAPAGAIDSVLRAVEAGCAEVRGRVFIDAGVGPLEVRERQQRELQAAGASMLDAPVMGNPALVDAGQGVFYVSGDAKVSQRVRPLLLKIAAQAPQVGAFGAGTQLKLASNLLLAVHTAAAAEAMALLTRAGLDPALLLENLPPIARSGVLATRGAAMASGRYDVGGGSTQALLEVMERIAGDARMLQAKVPMLQAAMRQFEGAVEAGHGQVDTPGVIRAWLT
ncbi:NAD(P)-dependent oxidoreductase [Ramlibacter sp. AW1]|uniref:NAD(P)-dependent oxidoreductase n=1 Tax=Ramlibacter aurantiacus TaxID=2801330 RepID=A0A936ZNH9_9BURK|nr:NAD(P)-binding domain-containing protein [Ramlibacter aurantiacus]MBL0423002.1 NAD(P)-dependent oxidoreductase [Ramlibacter aurantiacus]